MDYLKEKQNLKCFWCWTCPNIGKAEIYPALNLNKFQCWVALKILKANYK